MKVSEHLAPVKNPVDLRLRRIADVLFLNAGFNDNPGLLQGKMGIAIFLFNYARRTGSVMYEIYAGELIDEIYNIISSQTAVGFSDGLTGIGWGIEYLVRNGFVEADTDEALAEIDTAIGKSLLKSPSLTEENNELSGFGFYYLARLSGRKNPVKNSGSIKIERQLLILLDEYEKLLIHTGFPGSDILSLNTCTINSILWFLLETHRLGLVPDKVKMLLQFLSSEIKPGKQKSDCWPGEFILRTILQRITPLIADTGLQNKCMAIAMRFADQHIETIPDDEILVSNFSSLAWQKLVYFPDKNNVTQLSQITAKVFKIIDDEENWDQRLDNLNRKNMGLTGFAGLGLGLMNETI
jgi:hypothetical protein